MSDPLLTVVGAHVYAGDGDARRVLVRDVGFSLDRGETLGVVGESGSGKSMLMKSILGLLPAGTTSEGQVTFDGTRIDGHNEKAMRRLRGRRVTLLLQDPFTMLNPLQTVGATIAETLRPESRRGRKGTAAEVHRRLAEVGIEPGVATKRPFQLSGGLRQRVAIAAALAGDPDLLVADEPTTALDVQTQDEVLRLLASLRDRRQMALALITHDLRVAFDVCDRILVMYAGSVMEQATSTGLRSMPRHPYTAGLIAAEPSVDRWTADLHAMPGSVPSPDAVRDECAFAARCTHVEDVCRQGAPTLVSVDQDTQTRCVRTHELVAHTGRETTTLGNRPKAPGTGPRPTPLLVVTGLQKTYHTTALAGGRQTHVALRGVDLVVGEGESVGLVGESGSGKTTIARAILGLGTPDAGSITLEDLDITDFRRLSRGETRQVRRSVQVVFQDPYASLNPALTVGRALREALKVNGTVNDIDAEVSATLERVGLPASYATRIPAGMSGGERQRISIARAVCLNPRLLICDEPVAALDVSVQAQVLELLRSLRDELGMAMLFITHDLAVVRQMTERVLVLDRGRVVEEGATDSVLDHPQDDYTRALMNAIPGRRQPRG